MSPTEWRPASRGPTDPRHLRQYRRGRPWRLPRAPSPAVGRHDAPLFAARRPARDGPLLSWSEGEPNLPSANGTTPLVVAIINNHIQLARYRSARADPNVADGSYKASRSLPPSRCAIQLPARDAPAASRRRRSARSDQGAADKAPIRTSDQHDAGAQLHAVDGSWEFRWPDAVHTRRAGGRRHRDAPAAPRGADQDQDLAGLDGAHGGRGCELGDQRDLQPLG
jgi:hypothetical protein